MSVGEGIIAVLLGALNVLLYWSVRKWGVFTDAQRESTESTKEMIASTNLVFASLIDAMATIARIRQDGGNLPPKEPNPAPFTPETPDEDAA